MSTTRVLLVGQDPSLPGGMAKYIGGLTRYLESRADIEMTFLNETSAKRRRGMTSANKLTAAVETAIIARVLQREIRRVRPHVVHLNVAHGLSILEKSLLARIAARQNTPALLHVHAAGFDHDLQHMNRVKHQWLAGALMPPNRAVLLSKGQQVQLRRSIPHAASDVVTNSVDLIDPAPPFGAGPLTVGFIGFMDGRKGESTLIAALARCKDPSIRAILAGDGPGRKHAEKAAATLGVAARVKFLGLIDAGDKDRFFRGIDLLCLPSRAENLPIALLEAMAYGRTVVATPVGAITDLVCDGLNGRLVSPDDPDGLAQVMDDFCKDRPRVQRFGRNAWHTIEEEHTWTVNGPRMTAIYHSVHASSLPDGECASKPTEQITDEAPKA